MDACRDRSSEEMQSLEVRSRVAVEAWARLPSQDTSQGQRSAPLFPWMVSIPTRPPGAFPWRGKSLVNEVIAGVRPNHVCLKRMCKSCLKCFLERNERGGLRGAPAISTLIGNGFHPVAMETSMVHPAVYFP